MKSELSRRELLQAGIAGLACLAIGHGRSATEAEALKPQRAVSLTTGRDLPSKVTTCGMCPAGCGILVYVDGRDIVSIMGNPLHPYNRGKICALGSAGVNLFKDTQRLTKPLRRVGGRGEGRWREITWAEAIAELATRLGKVRAEALRGSGSKWAFVISHEYAEEAWFLRRFLAGLGNSVVLDEVDGQRARADEEAHQTVCGFKRGIPDFGHADTIFNFGADLFGNHRRLVGCGVRFFEARSQRRAYLVTLDPRHSTTASVSDEWIPLKPGTDYIVALAMAKVMLEEGMADEAFLARSADASAAVLKEAFKGFDLRRAATVTGVDLLTIRRLVERFAQGSTRSVAIYGSGVLGHEHGSFNAQCVLLLNVLVGNLDQKGGYVRVAEIPGFDPAHPLSEGQIETLPGTLLWELEQGGRQIAGLFTFEANPAYECPSVRRVGELLKNEDLVPFHVAMDSSMTETAALADLVLPSCTYLERWGLHRGSLPGTQYLSVRQPVVPPLGEARPLEDVLIELGAHMGPELIQHMKFKGAAEYYEWLVRKFSRGMTQNDPWQELRTQGYLFVSQSSPLSPFVATQEGRSGFFTARNMLLPAVTWGITYIDSTPALRKRTVEKVLVLFSGPVHGSRTAGCKWLGEIEHAAPLLVHPATAREIGCAQGDVVRVKSSEGAITVRVQLTEGIHPDVVAMSATQGHSGFGPLLQGRPFSSEDPDTMLLWWAKEVSGENPRILISWSKDPVHTGPRLMETLVTIEKD